MIERLQGLAEAMPPGIHKLEDLYDLASEHLLHLRGYSRSAGLASLRYILNHHGPSVGIQHPRRGGYTIGKRAANDWAALLAAEWQSVAELLATARALDFDLPEGEHSARIEIGREIRKVPGVQIKFRSGQHQYRGTPTYED